MSISNHVHFETPYDAGFDAGKYGSNNFNSHHSWVDTKEKTQEWQRGNTEGRSKREVGEETKKLKPNSPKL